MTTAAIITAVVVLLIGAALLLVWTLGAGADYADQHGDHRPTASDIGRARHRDKYPDSRCGYDPRVDDDGGDFYYRSSQG